MSGGIDLVEHFKDVEDPRVTGRTAHQLVDIIVIGICAVICHAETWVDVEEFGKAKEEWLRSFLELPNGIPSHDTFGRVFGQLDPTEFRKGFLSWVRSVQEVTQGDIVAIDGKTARRTHDRASGRGALHMISAWSTANQLVLGQRKVGEETNELGALPDLLQILELEGCIVTIDAIACQESVAKDLRARGADYVLAVKANQPKLLDRTQKAVAAVLGAPENIDHDHHRSVEKDHGRVELRECWVVSDPEYLRWVDPDRAWQDLRSLILISAERRQGDRVQRSERFYISSLGSGAADHARAIRAHWEVENSLHWVLDVSCGNDAIRVRTGNAAENLTVLQHLAVSMVKQEKTSKRSVNGKRLRAGWDNDYLRRVIDAA